MNKSNDVQFRVRIEDLERKLRAVEVEQKEQRQCTIDNEGRITAHMHWHNNGMPGGINPIRWWQFWK